MVCWTIPQNLCSWIFLSQCSRTIAFQFCSLLTEIPHKDVLWCWWPLSEMIREVVSGPLIGHQSPILLSHWSKVNMLASLGLEWTRSVRVSHRDHYSAQCGLWTLWCRLVMLCGHRGLPLSSSDPAPPQQPQTGGFVATARPHRPKCASIITMGKYRNKNGISYQSCS